MPYNFNFPPTLNTSNSFDESYRVDFKVDPPFESPSFLVNDRSTENSSFNAMDNYQSPLESSFNGFHQRGLSDSSLNGTGLLTPCETPTLSPVQQLENSFHQFHPPASTQSFSSNAATTPPFSSTPSFSSGVSTSFNASTSFSSANTQNFNGSNANPSFSSGNTQNFNGSNANPSFSSANTQSFNGSNANPSFSSGNGVNANSSADQNFSGNARQFGSNSISNQTFNSSNPISQGFNSSNPLPRLNTNFSSSQFVDNTIMSAPYMSLSSGPYSAPVGTGFFATSPVMDEVSYMDSHFNVNKYWERRPSEFVYTGKADSADFKTSKHEWPMTLMRPMQFKAEFSEEDLKRG